MDVNKIIKILFFPRKKCSHFIKCIKRSYKILFVNDSRNNNFLHMMKTCNSYNWSKKKIVLFNIHENNLHIRKRINKVLISSIILSSISICLIEFNILSNIYGYIIGFVLIVYMIMNYIFYNSLILRAVLDYHNKTLLLYPFMLIKRKDVLKQIIISLHDIKKIKKMNNYIKIYIKPKNIQDKHMKSWSFLNMLPYYFPRYNFSKNNILSKNKDEDMLYPYDFNNFNIAVFDKKLTNSSNITSMKIQKNVQGFPLNVHEENKLLSLLKL
ncbi:hypothetical protein PRSY57_0931400 [Plasmodium reichenowi]|uniref:Uncharacterized protein n=1 Tax=Plasmodium reichenowi TaxID=5854 RepID=A0A151LI58_PLARE|nr:hypothetical protein PRSY57_0931400 [Plasmodium reichenowi]KYN98633.1 hypothetical protein PRSY57_0931400 [Plasmodium reichenowi]